MSKVGNPTLTGSPDLGFAKPRFSTGYSIRAARAVDLIAGRLGATRPIYFVSGFWRSGTTWLMELLADGLAAKTVFEPLSPLNPLRESQLIAAGLGDPDMRQAFIPGRTPVNDRMWPYLDAAFLAITGNQTSISCRRAVSDSFRRAVVVKDVRLQLNLETVHRRYAIPVVHVRRHPCAVVSSMLAVRWGWSFDRLRLASLIAPFAGDLPDGLTLDAGALEAFDGDGVSRIAAYWAVTERLTERSLRGQSWGTILSYESAVRDPEAAIQYLCGRISRRPAPVGDPDLDSATTFGSARGTASKLRPDAWRNRLSRADIDKVYRVVDAIYPEALASLTDRSV